MMDAFLIWKWIHILSAAVLFGTGLGIAFFMFMAHRTGSPVLIAGVGRIVVVADFLFTATAVVVQPVSGIALAVLAGYSLLDEWLLATYALYVLIGCCWLPVVWIQWKMQKLAQFAADTSDDLPAQYHQLFAWWFWLGWPAFASVMGIYVLMLLRPAQVF